MIENNLIKLYADDFPKKDKDEKDKFKSITVQKSTKLHEINAKIICAPNLNIKTESIISSKISEINGLILMFNTKDSKSFENIKKFVEDNKNKLKTSLSWFLFGIITKEKDSDEDNFYARASFSRQYYMNIYEQLTLDK